MTTNVALTNITDLIGLYGGRTRDRTLDLSRVKGTLSRRRLTNFPKIVKSQLLMQRTIFYRAAQSTLFVPSAVTRV